MDFLQIFPSDFILRNALWGSVAVGLFCPLIGVYFFLRRMVLMGVALPQVSAAGIAFVFYLQGIGIHWSLHAAEPNDKFFALIGSLAFTIASIFILAALERRNQATIQNRIGATYAIAYAAAILLVAANPKGEIELLGMLHGEIVSVSAIDLKILLVVFAILTAVLLGLNRQLLLVSFDRDFAQSVGRSTIAWDILLYSIVGVAISMSVLIVGPMLTFAAFVIPPLAARRFCRRMTPFFLGSSILGGISGVVGFYVSYHFDLPLGPTDIAVYAVVLALCVTARKIQLALRTSAARSA
jgi:ABC-type Mn2+/Zn2+ transport system permease subunit